MKRRLSALSAMSGCEASVLKMERSLLLAVESYHWLNKWYSSDFYQTPDVTGSVLTGWPGVSAL